jgi:hypothetical protein
VVFSNRSADKPAEYALTPDDRVALWKWFSADVARLEGMLGIDLSRWEPVA